MLETPGEVAALQALLDESYAGAGAHLRSVIHDGRTLSAEELVAYLVGVRHFVVATVGASGEPLTSAADGLFLHGRLWFTSSADSVKVRHLEARPAVSASHVVGDTVGVFVHGRARVVRGATPEAAALAPSWRDVYDSTPEDWVDAPGDARFVEVVPRRVFTYCHDRAGLGALVAS